MSHFKKKQEYIETILGDLINLLPSSYNKETTDTNYYKLLRALAIELADNRVEVENVKDNTYLETVHPDMIYNNFGTLVKLQKMPEWDDEQYRDLIKGVIQSLLIGPTKQSLIQAFKMFTNFDVQVHELYKDKDKVDPGVYHGYNPKYTFLLEIEKPLEAYAENKTIQRDANYIIGILKPAHTVGLQIINLTDNEDFRYYYGVDKQVNDLSRILVEESITKKISELVDENRNELINNYANGFNVSLNDASFTIYKRNYGMSQSSYNRYLESRAKQLYDEYLRKFTINNKNLNDNAELVQTLDINNFRNIIYSILREEYENTPFARMMSNTENIGDSKYEAEFTILSGENPSASIIFNANKSGSNGYEIKVDIYNGSIIIIDLKQNSTITNDPIANSPEIGKPFNFKINYSSSNIEVLIDNKIVLNRELPVLNNWYYGFQTDRNLIKISKIKVNDKDISAIEREYDSINPDNYWSVPKNHLLGADYGTWCYIENNSDKYLLVPGLMDKNYLIDYKQKLYIKDNGDLTQTKLEQKINNEKEILKLSYIKRGFDPSLISDSDWTTIAENSLKNKLLRDDIINSLGGSEKLYSYYLAEASKFKDDFERVYNADNPYIGMDKVDVESENKNSEGHFGWKHLSYKGQLTTSISFKGPKIGSTNLIGPRYTLYDDSNLNVENFHFENIDIDSLEEDSKVTEHHMDLEDNTYEIRRTTLTGETEKVIKREVLDDNELIELTDEQLQEELKDGDLTGVSIIIDENGNKRYYYEVHSRKQITRNIEELEPLETLKDRVNKFRMSTPLNTNSPRGHLFTQKFKKPLEQTLAVKYEIEDEFRFTYLREIFTLNRDFLNTIFKPLGAAVNPNIEHYDLDVDFEENVAFIFNVNQFRLNLAMLNKNIRRYDSYQIHIDGFEEKISFINRVNDHDKNYEMNQEVTHSDKFYTTQLREIIKIKRDNGGTIQDFDFTNQELELVDPIEELEFDLTEDIGLVSSYTPFILNLSNLNSTDKIGQYVRDIVEEAILSKIDEHGNEIIIERRII